MTKKNYLLAFIFVIGLIFLSVATVPAAVPADCPAGIISYWTLNEKVAGVYADSLNVNPGVGAADPEPTTGIIQGAQLFDGSNDTGIDAADVADSWEFGSEDSFTFELWMKIDADLGDGNVEVIFGRDDAADPAQFWVGIQGVSGGTVAAAFLRSSTGEGATIINGTTPLNDGEWHHIVFVRNNADNTNKIYVDGQEEGTGLAVDYADDFDMASAPITMGYLGVTPFFSYTGSIDEVAVYGRALPQPEIEQHFEDELNYCGETLLETVVPGDLNNDGRDDLVGISPSGDIYYSLYLSAWVKIPGQLESIVTGDFNGDGNDDIAGVNSAGLVFYTTDLGDNWTQIPGTARTIVAGDFDGDGDDDIAGINPDGVVAKIFYTTDLSTWTAIPGLITAIAVGDFNNDGNDDIAGINPDGVVAKIFYTTDLTTWTPIPGLITSIAVGDFNNDGDDDIVGINPDGVISKIFYTTDLVNWLPIPGLITSIAVGDFNDDGDDDIAGINPNGVSFKIFYTTNLSTWTSIAGELATITSGDFDDDGNDDLAGVNSANQAIYTIDFIPGPATWIFIP